MALDNQGSSLPLSQEQTRIDKKPNDTKVKRGTSNRGFASMDPELQRKIARKGGKSVPSEKRSFSRNPQLAAEAGRKGGQNSSGGGRQTH